MMVTRRLLASLALSLLAACVSTPRTSDTTGAAPALFVARDADSTLYLYGTIHLRRAGDAWGGAHVERALAESQEVWTEVGLDPASEARAQAEAMRLGFSADDALANHLTTDDQLRLSTLAQGLGIPPQALDRMRPWMAALTLSLVPIVRAGYDPGGGVDRAVVAWAREHDKTLRAFETPEEQVHIFSGFGEDVQLAMLRSALDGAEESVDAATNLSAAWDRGDIRALEELAVTDARVNYPLMYQAIYATRNNAWISVLSHEMDGAGVDFVAVGAGHLYGPDGLIAQLRARGILVERVQ
ncbi:MAG: TraB/GumN family protein [Alphaproteobacteria bacterium]|nr:TraB/GumN family protein [Alphaproteobacteria bacterium]